MKYYYKDPDAVKDYEHNWSEWLETGDQISTSSWVVSPTGSLTIDGDAKTSTTTKVWLSGGIVGTTYTLTNHITTVDGREEDWSFYVYVQEN